MKKQLLTIALAFIVLASFGQGKPKMKYYAEMSYHTSCKDGILYMLWPKYPTYNELVNDLKKWTKPYKVTNYEVIKIRPATKEDLKLKGDKFQCDEKPQFTFTTPSLIYTEAHSTGLTFNRAYQIYDYVYMGKEAKVTFSPPDSTSTVTMKIHGLTKINDSTYTFKQLK